MNHDKNIMEHMLTSTLKLKIISAVLCPSAREQSINEDGPFLSDPYIKKQTWSLKKY